MKLRLRTLAIATAIVLTLAVGAAALMVQLGVYNIAATEQHTRPVFALTDHAMRRAVIARGKLNAPPQLNAPARVARGAGLYRAHCVQCHGAPGIAPEPFAFGLLPAPANLVNTARDWRPSELFWVIKYGIKMTGMPAWIYRLEDEEIWDLVAFLEGMTRMTPADYDAVVAQAPPPVRRLAESPLEPAQVLGDPAAGKRAAGQYLCATCHFIPGFVGARQHVGPALSGVARRAYLGGVASNTPENMVRWLKDPQAIDPKSAMPALGLTDRDARDIAAFMYTLDDVNAK